MPTELPRIGWREWTALPELGIDSIKAKVDTGARTSALHAFDLEYRRRGRTTFVTFKVHPLQDDTRRTVSAEAELVDERLVRNTGGAQSLRPVIRTPVEVAGQTWEIELTLVGRDEMGFRMLLGRQAVRRRFLVDPGRSFLGRRLVKKKKKKKKKRKKKKGRGIGPGETFL